MRTLLIVFLFLLPVLALNAQKDNSNSDWKPWQFILGEWVGLGVGAAGKSTGSSKFYFDLDSTIIIRENFAEYPASAGRHAYSHKDKMIIYKQASSFKAFYSDNEGHVIEYNIKFSTDLDTITFLSEPFHMGPAFKLTYIKLNAESIRLNFEIAPPDNPNSFALYLTADMKKKSTCDLSK